MGTCVYMAESLNQLFPNIKKLKKKKIKKKIPLIHITPAQNPPGATSHHHEGAIPASPLSLTPGTTPRSHTGLEGHFSPGKWRCLCLEWSLHPPSPCSGPGRSVTCLVWPFQHRQLSTHLSPPFSSLHWCLSPDTLMC